MEYIPGVKIDNLQTIDKLGLNRSIIAQRLAESYMIQLCEHGFFHCDPHVRILFIYSLRTVYLSLSAECKVCLTCMHFCCCFVH